MIFILGIITEVSGQELISDGFWCAVEQSSSQLNPEFSCTGQMAGCVYSIVWVRVLLMSVFWTQWPMVVMGFWQLMAIWMHRNTVTRSWGRLGYHLSTLITSTFSTIMHGPCHKDSWQFKIPKLFHGLHIHACRHVTHWTSVNGCCCWRLWVQTQALASCC